MSKLPKRWWTLAWLDRVGQPCVVSPSHQFVQVYKDERVLLEDLVHGMRNFSRGAYVAAAWEGQLSSEIARSRRPKFYVWENGETHTFT